MLAIETVSVPDTRQTRRNVVFTTDRRRARREAEQAAARAAVRRRLEEALAPYENAVIDLRTPPPRPPARVPRRARPLVYVASDD